MKELEHAQQNLEYLNKQIEQFLSSMSQEDQKVTPLHFSGVRQKWKSQLSEMFTLLEVQLSQLS